MRHNLGVLAVVGGWFMGVSLASGQTPGSYWDEGPQAALPASLSTQPPVSDLPATTLATESAVSSVCNSCCDAGPLWIVTADALILQRRDPAAAVLAINTANAAQQLNAANFNFSWQGGYDLSAIRRLGNDNAIEVRFFDLNQFGSNASVATTPNDLLQINTAIPVFTFSGSQIAGSYATRFLNTELNGYQQWNDWLALLAGFRYVELDERLNFGLVGSAVPFDYAATTRNRLYGFQVGGKAMALDRGGPFRLDLIGKAGIYGNPAAQDSSFSTGLVTFSSSRRASPTAFLGELAAIGRYEVTDHVAVRGGYRLFWIDGVALASDQVAVTAFVPPALAPGRGINSSGDLLFHGAVAGLEVFW